MLTKRNGRKPYQFYCLEFTIVHFKEHYWYQELQWNNNDTFWLNCVSNTAEFFLHGELSHFLLWRNRKWVLWSKWQSSTVCFFLWLLIVSGMHSKDEVYFSDMQWGWESVVYMGFFFFKLRNLTNVPKAYSNGKIPQRTLIIIFAEI